MKLNNTLTYKASNFFSLDVWAQGLEHCLVILTHNSHLDGATRLSSLIEPKKHVMNTSEQGKSCNEQNNTYLCASWGGGCHQGRWWLGHWRPVVGTCLQIFHLPTCPCHQAGWRQWSDQHFKPWPKYSLDFFNGGIYIYILKLYLY
jgi:hypothetical protein